MTRNVSIFALPIYWLVVMATRMYTPFHIKMNTKDSSSAELTHTASEPSSNPKPNNLSTAQDTNPTAQPQPSLASNANPHSTLVYSSIQSSLSPRAYQRWERIQAAHRNGWENMSFFFPAVVLGNFARLNALELNLCSWLFVAARIAYVFLYVGLESEKLSYLRSAAFGVGVFLCWWLYLRSAVFVLYGYHELH